MLKSSKQSDLQGNSAHLTVLHPTVLENTRFAEELHHHLQHRERSGRAQLGAGNQQHTPRIGDVCGHNCTTHSLWYFSSI